MSFEAQLHKRYLKFMVSIVPKDKIWSVFFLERVMVNESSSQGSKLAFYIPFNSQGHVGTGSENFTCES